MKLSRENTSAVAQWMLDRIASKGRFMDDLVTLAAFDGDRLIGAVAFDTITPHDCEMHIVLADKHCVSRGTIRQIFALVFNTLNLQRVTAQVASRNERSLEFVQRLGFKLEGIKERGYGDDDQLIFGMLRKNCRWLT